MSIESRLARRRGNSSYAQKRRQTTHRMYGHKWQQHRLNFLAQNPLCVKCLEESKITVATVVDHIKPWRIGLTEEERYRLFWNPENHQSLCSTHHSRKTAKEDGGFGNKIKGTGE